MGNFFCCCRSEEAEFNDGGPECEQPSSVILVQEKNTFAGKDGEGETTSKAENKCQSKIKLEKSTSEMQKEENQETANDIQDNLEKEKCVEDNFDAKQKVESLETPCSDEELVKTEVKENFSSEETEEIDVANVVVKPEVDDGAETMSQFNEAEASD